MQNVRLKVERIYVVRIQGGVHMPEVSLQIKAGEKKPLSNLGISLIVALGFFWFCMFLGFWERGYFDYRMEALLSMLLWLFVYNFLEELRT